MSHPYLPLTEEEMEQMLNKIGVKNFNELVEDIPAKLYLPEIDIPASISEIEILSKFKGLAAKNCSPSDYSCFLGGGAYRHYIPSVIKSIVSRGEFLTAYTPYQAEVQQGTLLAAFEFQRGIANLFDMELANAGMYDGATALAEAALMACRITKKSVVAFISGVFDRYIQVFNTYATYQGIEVIELKDGSMVSDELACVIVQSPNKHGLVQNLKSVKEMTEGKNCLTVACVNPLSCVLFQTPGEAGMDICVGEGQPLGVPLSFGGPYIGLFACSYKFVRQMPGRLVGMTKDSNGKRGYVLTLQTREQHIRRGAATSNICTSTQLVALMISIYIATLGKENIKEVANQSYQKAHYAAEQISKIDGLSLAFEGEFFNEFVVNCPIDPDEINAKLLENKIIGGMNLKTSTHKNQWMLACTELNTKTEIDKLVKIVANLV